MSETPKKLNVDGALREWPAVEKPAKEWDEFATTIESRVARGDRGATLASIPDEDLFSDPLGQIPEDGHNSAGLAISGSTPEGPTMTMPVDRERDRRSLQDLAKMALTPPPPSTKSQPSGVQRAAEAKKDDSGIVDLAMAAASDPAAEVRSQATPLASQGLFDDEPASIRPPAQPVPSIPPMPASMPPASHSAPVATVSSAPVAHQSAVTSSQVAPLPAKKSSGGVVIALVLGGLVAASAAAAGGFMFLKHRAAQQLTAATTTVTTPAQPAAVTAAPAEAKPTTTVAAADPTPAPADDATDPNALPNGKTTAGKKLAFAKGTAPAAKDPGPALAAAPEAPKAPEQPKLAQKDLPKTDNAPPGDLGKAMQTAVGPQDKPAQTEQTPAAGGTQYAAGSVPQKPSQGAVTGAIGAVLGGARSCLGPDDPVSHASIVFGSNGSVQSVSVSGGAAGKPAEACIKGALSKAKVAPFAEPSYTARVTVRH